MISETEVQATIEKLQGSGKTFAEFVADLFKNEFIEIYVGDTYEQVSIEQISIEYPAVFCGKVMGAYKECLVISAAYIDDQKKIKLGNLLFINERAIRTLNHVNNNSMLEDMFLRSREAVQIKNYFKS